MPVDVRREQLITAAMHVISREGVAKASTRRIAEAAGANLASVHYTFRNKDEMFAGVLEHAVEAIKGVLQDSTLPPRSGLAEAVRMALHVFHDPMLNDTDPIRAQFELLFWSLRSEVAGTTPRATYDTYFREFEKVFDVAADTSDHDVDRRKLARITASFIDGMLLQMLFFGGSYQDDIDFGKVGQGLVEAARAPA